MKIKTSLGDRLFMGVVYLIVFACAGEYNGSYQEAPE